jgi:Domain of unknown function (DUF4304)
VLAAIHALLKPRGWKRKGQAWRRDLEEVVMFVQLQRGHSSLVGAFCVNLGVTSRRVFETIKFPGQEMHTSNSHWRRRLTLDGSDGDHWWPLSDHANVDRAANEVICALSERALPEMERYGSDAALRDRWATDTGAGLTDVRRLMYLGILAREIGPRSLLDTAIAALERFTHIVSVRELLDDLRQSPQ